MTDQTWAWVQTVAWVAIWAAVALVVAVLIFGDFIGDFFNGPAASPCRLDSPGVCQGGGQ